MLSEDPKICKNIIKRHKVELPLSAIAEFNDDDTLLRVATLLQNILKIDKFAKEMIFEHQGHLFLIKLVSSKNESVKRLAEEMIDDLKKRKFLTEDQK